MRIGEVAERSGVSVRALRYYEEQDILASVRTAGGQRQYSEDAVDQVRLIQQLYASGLSSKLVRDVLPRCLSRGDLPEGFLDTLRIESERIAMQIADLTAVHERLIGLIAAADDPTVCNDRDGSRLGLHQ